MSFRAIRLALLLAIPLLATACSVDEVEVVHADCRQQWMKTFNVIFDSTVSASDVSWVHDCMAKKGYARLYDADRCRRLRASVREPRCYTKVSDT